MIMRFGSTLSTTIAMAALWPMALAAAPFWAERVDEQDLTQEALTEWKAAAELWDTLNHQQALTRLRKAVELESGNAELWYALASAAEAASGKPRRQEALRCIALADHALDRLAQFEEISAPLETRISILERAVAAQRADLVEELVTLEESPPTLRALRPGLVTRAPVDRTNAPAGAGGGGGGFYGANSDHRNGNYNVLARRQADLVGAGYRGGPKPVGLGLSGATSGGLQPALVGFGNPTGPPIVNSRWNKNWSERRKTR
jgi:tetratricopeptide (TPR) repeat protein